MDKVNETKKLGISFKFGSDVEMYIYGNTIDELIDGLALIKDGKFINQFVNEFKSLTEEQLLRLDKIMLTTDSAIEIVEYAKRRKDKINTIEYQNKLIELKNMYILIRFTAFAIQPNIVNTEDAIIDYGDASVAVNLLENVEGVNVEKMKKFIFDSKDAHSAYQLIIYFQNKEKMLNMNDILEAKKIVIESKNMNLIYYWAEYIGDVTEMEDVTIKYGSAYRMWEFALGIKNANIEKIREAINKTGDQNLIMRFNSYFPKPIIKSSFWSKFKK